MLQLTQVGEVVVILCASPFIFHLYIPLTHAPPHLPHTHNTHTHALTAPLSLLFPGPQCPNALGSRPASPQPIRLTRPVLKQTAAADIVLENPVETG